MTREEMIALLETRVDLILTRSLGITGAHAAASRSMTSVGLLQSFTVLRVETTSIGSCTFGRSRPINVVGQLPIFRSAGLHVRVLKERRATYPGGVPAAGLASRVEPSGNNHHCSAQYQSQSRMNTGCSCFGTFSTPLASRKDSPCGWYTRKKRAGTVNPSLVISA